MNLHGFPTRTIIALAGTTLVLGSSATAQEMDMAVYNRWAPVVVVHYVVVGEFMGEIPISGSVSGVSARATVKDRFEIAFDWDQSELKLLGTPVIKNSPTTVDNVTAYAGCGTPRLTGAYEHVTYLAVTTGTGHLNASVKRDYVAADVAQKSDDPNTCGPSVTIPATSETADGMILIQPPMAYAMPASAGVKLSPDGKSIIMADGTDWTLTYTMTAVR